MSRAELKARSLYKEMNLESVDEEVKRCLMIMMLSKPEEVSSAEVTLEPYTAEELLGHLEASQRAIQSDEILSMSEAHARIENFVSSL